MPDNSSSFRHWTPDFNNWPSSWMGVREDLDFGRKLLPYFAGFLQVLYAEGLTRSVLNNSSQMLKSVLRN